MSGSSGRGQVASPIVVAGGGIGGGSSGRDGDINGVGGLTYEATMARESINNYPDKIHWQRNISYRSQPYRQLHHQKGLIGTFTIRLLEAKDLKRSYWSALALGPMKHLGLSTAHGPISSYCTFYLNYQSVYDKDMNNMNSSTGGGGSGRSGVGGSRRSRKSNSMSSRDWSDSGSDNSNNFFDQKLPARATTSNSGTGNTGESLADIMNSNTIVVTSPIISQNNNPVWTDCCFQIPLQKGMMVNEDGLRIMLNIRVDEDSTAVENFIPGIPSGGDSRLIGTGDIDLTSLCLGETMFGQPQVGVIDGWVPIRYHINNNTNNNNNNDDDYEDSTSNEASESYTSGDDNININNNNYDDIARAKKRGGSGKQKYNMTPNIIQQQPVVDESITGRVRVLISYTPHGLDPQQNDIVALEAFARRSIQMSSCMPVMPPLLPLTVKEIRGAYYKVEYILPLSINNPSRGRGDRGGGGANRSDSRSGNTPTRRRRSRSHGHHHHPNPNHCRKGYIRVHRNSIFVIERKNFMDNTMNIALLPADIIMSTSIGRGSVQAMTPFVIAGRELMMPAMLSFKLLWLAVKTTASAGLAGISAVSGTFISDGIINPLSNDEYEPQNNNEDNHHHHRRNNNYDANRKRATERIASL